MAVVEVRNLTKNFDGGRGHGHVRAIDGIGLATREGEYLVLLGPSGCGKTTLLRTIAGLEEPTEGEVLIGGNVVDGLPPRLRRIMVFQSYALYPHKTVLDNIVFPLKRSSSIGQNGNARLAGPPNCSASITCSAAARGNSPAGNDSASRSRALVREPAVFLLDELLSNLDAKLRASARDELKRFQRRVGTTTIYVTHDQSEAMGLGDRIAVMESGRVRQLASPLEVYDEPSDTFVATFLGSPPMNLVPRDGHLVGFRPEHLLPEDVVPVEDKIRVPFTVDRIEYLSGRISVRRSVPVRDRAPAW